MTVIQNNQFMFLVARIQFCRLKEKVNNITIDKCTKMGVLFKDVVAACEIVNCNSVEVQCQGSAPTISVDNTTGCRLYLSKDSLETSITTAKSSEINVMVPASKTEGDWFLYKRMDIWMDYEASVWSRIRKLAKAFDQRDMASHTIRNKEKPSMRNIETDEVCVDGHAAHEIPVLPISHQGCQNSSGISLVPNPQSAVLDKSVQCEILRENILCHSNTFTLLRTVSL